MSIELPPGACYVPEIHGEIAQKKPRLMVWCEAENCWTPATAGILWAEAEGLMLHSEDGETSDLNLKTVFMTDAEFEAIPEG